MGMFVAGVNNLPGSLLVARLHVDLARIASALCRRGVR